jgi:ribosomal protein L6P/L9E
MKIIFYGSNHYELSLYLTTITSWRPMNVYHGRGLRLARQRVMRKAGKVSAYR